MDSPSWTRQTHSVFGSRALTAEDPRASEPPGFRGRLWAPQATLLQAMLDLEARPLVRVEVPEPGSAAAAEAPLLQTRTARIAAEFSFGKTVLCVALVCASRCPRAFPTPLNSLTMPVRANQNRLAVALHGPSSSYAFEPNGRGAFPTLAARYRRVLRATLVVAASSVISQWEGCLREYAPHLDFFTIEDVRSLRAFGALFRTEAMGRVDLVLLKAGKVTTSFVVEGEPKPARRQRALTRALYMVTEGHVWARMVVDDFDTIRLASEDVFLPSLFTWVISATCRSTTARLDVAPAPTVAEFLRANAALPILQAASDVLFENVLKLHCDGRYVRAHISSTTVEYRRIVVEGGNAVGILQDLGVPADVVEMAAAGAVETAAERLGIKVRDIGELVGRVLAARTQKYRKAARAAERVRRARAAAARAGAGPPNGRDAVKEIRAALKGGSEAEAGAALARLGRSGPPFEAAMKTLEAWAAKELEEHGGRLRRMRANVRQNQCQACMVPIDDESYIVNCCQIVVCGFCTIVGEGRRRRYIRRCPNCAAAVDPRRHLIYVGGDLELETALTDEALLASPPEEEPEPEPEPEAPPAPDAYAPWAGDARLRALLQLVRGDPVDSVADGEVPPIVRGLLEGRRRVPVPAGGAHKYLVFAMHAESARQIVAALAALGVEFVQLRGTRKQKDAAVRRFRERGGADLMVATSSRDCAGLHLPEVTRLVLYHHHRSRKVAEQAVGRAQRVGREHSLEVIELMNAGEAERFG